MVKHSPTNSGYTKDSHLILGSERSPGVENGNLIQYSCLENPTDREACWVTVHGLPESWTQLSTYACTMVLLQNGGVLAQAPITRYCRLGVLNKRNSFLILLEAGRVPAWLNFCEG